MLGALGRQGRPAVMTVNGATDADVLRPDGKRVLGPTLAPGATVGMANLSAHKAVGVQQALARRGARLLSVPPDSPDLSPMERCVRKLKPALRAAKARTRAAREIAIPGAMKTVTALDARNGFRHCGYAL
jgi:transposase